MKNVSRRNALKSLCGAALSLSLSGCMGSLNRARTTTKPQREAEAAEASFDAISPIDRTLGEVAPAAFSGDAPMRAHGALWDKKNYLASKGVNMEASSGAIRGILKTPGIPTEKVPLVVVGGGMSGMMTSYLLRDLKPVLLEQAPRFGGNAKGESWRGINYSIGAAYFMKPDAGTPWEKLLQELGADKHWRVKTEEDPVSYGGKVFTDFWNGVTAPESAAQFKRLAKHFSDMYNGRNGLAYPDMPTSDPKMRKYVDKLDRISFRDYVRKVAGGPVHPHIETALEHYCWSTFGGSYAEISAASGLNQYTAEFEEMVVMPGGNSFLGELTLKKLVADLPASHLRPSSLVVDVDVRDDGAHVLYEDASGQLREIVAEAVVMATPKFVAGHLLRDIEPQRLAAIKKLRYRSYLVANVLLNGAPPKPFYDLYMLADGKVNFSDVPGSTRAHQATDVILANYAGTSDAGTVLTLYRGFPYDGARPELYAESSYAKYRQEFEQQIHSQVLPLLGLHSENIVDLRLTRWGHPMPLSGIGQVADGTMDAARATFKKRVFFVEQDNWMLPCVETCSAEALAMAPKIRKFLKMKA